MSPGDRLRELRVLAAHRARIALTLLGIVIGSGSVVFIAALVQGGEGALVRTNQRATDAALISVSPQAPSAAVRHRTTRPLSRWDGAELASSEALGGAWVGSEWSRQTRAFLLGPAAIGKSRGERSRRITLVSASTRAPELYRLRLAEGRFFDEVNLRERRAGSRSWAERSPTSCSRARGSTTACRSESTARSGPWSACWPEKTHARLNQQHEHLESQGAGARDHLRRDALDRWRRVAASARAAPGGR